MFWKFSVSNRANPTKQSGFGLIELMVSISIMILVVSIVVTGQSSFNSSVLLRSEAYDIALRIREVQLNAVSASSDGSNDFRSVLGVHFDETTNNQRFAVFKDSDGDNYYDGVGEQFDIQGVINPRFVVSDIREVGGTTATPDELSIVFERPNFDAKFFDSPGNELTGSAVQIDLQEIDTGDVRTIEVTATGQIGVI
tara:strand:+ start:1927 stop:2517 length:591 start_codon:yes stop_codon:yes gene_type:complete